MAKNENLIKLIKRAKGDRTQQAFANIAGISQYNLSRIMQGNTKGNIQKSTLQHIAEASEGRVSEAELYMACGYIKTESEDLDDTTAPIKAKILAELIADKANAAMGKLVYPTIETFILQILAEAGIAEGLSTRVQVYADNDCTYIHPCNAEREAIVRIVTTKSGYDMKFPCIIYYVKTMHGNVVPLAYDSSLSGLARMRGLEVLHPDAQQIIMELSSIDDVVLTDYPYVYSCKPHRASSEETALLSKLFGMT